ncbi:MAG: Uma2 family endonuclease [Armatimonas sp.]
MPTTLHPSHGLLRFPLAEGLELRLRPGLDTTTRAGFDALCEDNPELRIERRSNGELTIDMPTKGFTGARNALLALLLGVWSLQNGEGIAFDSSAGFALPDGSILSPDAAWVRKSDLDSLTEEQKEDYLPVVPEFVVEIRSKSDRLTIVREKLELWRTNGVRLGLLINPQAKTVEIYRTGQPQVTLTNPTTVDCSPELPGLLLDVQKIFDM